MMAIKQVVDGSVPVTPPFLPHVEVFWTRCWTILSSNYNIIHDTD